MHDSGKRQSFSTGAVRDSAEDKPALDLISPFAELRLGAWLARGAKKYACSQFANLLRCSQIIEEGCTCASTIKLHHVILSEDTPLTDFVLPVTNSGTRRQNGQPVIQIGLRTFGGCAEAATIESLSAQIQLTPPGKQSTRSGGCLCTATKSARGIKDVTTVQKAESVAGAPLDRRYFPSMGGRNSTRSRCLTCKKEGALYAGAPREGARSTSTTLPLRGEYVDCSAGVAIRGSGCLAILRRLLNGHLITCSARQRISFVLASDGLELTIAGRRNWELGIPIERSFASLKRHVAAFQSGDRSEDNLAAIMCNAMFIMHTEEMVKRGVLPEALIAMPDYTTPYKRKV